MVLLIPEDRNKIPKFLMNGKVTPGKQNKIQLVKT
jgi:hypothetical protein